MSAPGYIRLDLDLAIVRTGERVVDVGVKYQSVTFLVVPAGIVATFALGTNKQEIPVIAAGQRVTNICPPADEGFFFTNPAGAGIVTIYVATSDAPQQLP